ncbi:MAG: cytochrome P450 [Pseudomonadota bacterium]
MTVAIPESNTDLFSDDTLINTERVYQELRAAGPIVRLPKNDLYAVTQFAPLREALRADSVLISGKGVAANDFMNGVPSHTTLISDDALHRKRRSILMRPLTPTALQAVKNRITSTADTLLQDLSAKEEVCGVKDFASHLPVSIVAELIGLEESGRENMLAWAAATFDALGPMNSRAEQALETAMGLIAYVQTLSPDSVRPGGWAEAILKEVPAGTLSPEEAAMMVVDYVAPALDTTILASAHMLWRLSTTKGAFDAVRADPDLIPSIVNESVRLASPIREFTRFAASDYVSDHGTIPEGARVAMLYASANWDERHYDRADQFVVDRNPRDHVGWGHGQHACAGMHLARMEMEALAHALVRHVADIETDSPTAILNNVLQGFAAMPTRFRAAA